jgi:hypothetical protein
MKIFVFLTIFYLVNFSLCASDIDKQIAVAVSFRPEMTSYSIATSTAPITRFYDNVVTYSMRYFLVNPADDDSDILYTAHSGTKATVIGNNSFLYSFNRQLTGGTFTNPSPFLDSDGTAPATTNLIAKNYQIGYKQRDGVLDYAYIAFNVVPKCTNTTPAFTINGNAPAIIDFEAKFFCSDEEAKAEFDSIIQSNANSNVAYFNMKGECTTSSLPINPSAIVGSVNICDLLIGKDNNSDAYCD